MAKSSIESHPHRVGDATPREKGPEPADSPEPAKKAKKPEPIPLPSAKDLKAGKRGSTPKQVIRVTVSKKEDGFVPPKDGSGSPSKHHGKPMYCVQWHDVYGVEDPKTGLRGPSPKHGRFILIANDLTRPIMELDGKTGAAEAYRAARFCIDCAELPDEDLCPLVGAGTQHRARLIALHDHLIDLVDEEQRNS